MEFDWDVAFPESVVPFEAFMAANFGDALLGTVFEYFWSGASFFFVSVILVFLLALWSLMNLARSSSLGVEGM